MIEARIEELRSLLNVVSNMPSKNIYDNGHGFLKKLKCRKGTAFVIDVERFVNYSCERTLFIEGSEVDWHFHEVIEIIIVLSGSMTLYTNGDGIRGIKVSRGDVFKFNPNEKHYAVFEEETEIYAIKIPSE